MRPLSSYIKNPRRTGLLLLQFTAKLFPDRLYLQILYWLTFGKKLDLSNPTSFNEKINWLKLYNRKPEYTMMVDKYAVKEYVAEKIGEEYVIPTLGVWNTPEEIDFDKLPNQFVLKTTHGGGGGGVIICRDKATFNIDDALRRLEHAMKADIYTQYREWPYKNIPRKIIAEKCIAESNDSDLKDYKFFCFNGKVEFCKVDFDRYVNHKANYYSPTWSLLPFGEVVYPPDFDKQIDCPPNFDKMLELAKELSKDIPFARIDLYNISGRTYFGEITFYPAGGMGNFTPIEADNSIGKLLKLPTGGGGYIIDYQQFVLHVHQDWDRVDLIDYKFFCFNGVPRLCQVISDRRSDEKIDFYDMDWNRIDGLVGLNLEVSNSDYHFNKPETFDKMKELTGKLSADIPFSRIDLYEVNGKCYFGEITFYPAGGMGRFRPEEWNDKIGSWIQLPIQ